ncbi:uncharacterized protein BDV17DRAFT_79134 [Aspergillus undulatus]|uniref:uncharacterized protein n=1 Tax=Aspergillus undulatus TaxID=1810928 RepID=UPI003CCD2211
MPIYHPPYGGYHFHHDDSFNNCMLCGVSIMCPLDLGIYVADDWLTWFRAAYDTPIGVRLSGIGYKRNRPDELWVPTDEHARAKTRGADTTGLLRLTRPPCRFQDFYLFQKICWRQIASHFRLGELNLDRLYAGLEVMPLPGGG